MSLTLTIKNFDIQQICDSGQCFRMSQLGDMEYQVISMDKMVKVYQDGETITFSCSQEEFDHYWRIYFDVDTDYGAIISMINPNDRYLTEAVSFGQGMHILNQDLWEVIVSFLISQQNNIKRIRHCIDLLCQTYGKQCTADDGTRYYAFPTPESLAGLEDDSLKECNLGYRSKYVVRTARAIVEGQIDLDVIENASHKEAKKLLMSCYGIGEKVAECICLFALHHLDAFPVDTHIKQVLENHYKRGFPNRRYKGYRGAIQQYLFFYDLQKKSPS